MRRHFQKTLKSAIAITTTYRQIFFLVLICSLTKYLVAQNNSDYLQWSPAHKLTVSDFAIKTKSLETTSSFAQFSFEYQLNGFDFLKNNFNKKVNNCICKTASWIDTTTNINQSLLYQQTLFDLSEIYTRQFRKSLKENRRKIVFGMQFAKELSTKFLTDFSKRRIDYDRETKYGSDPTLQKVWEIQIRKELLALDAFAYDK